LEEGDLSRSWQTTISDLIQISPEDFSKYSSVAIEDNINEKYANKVRPISPHGPSIADHASQGYSKDWALYWLL
jgi:hypothetical protein